MFLMTTLQPLAGVVLSSPEFNSTGKPSLPGEFPLVCSLKVLKHPAFVGVFCNSFCSVSFLLFSITVSLLKSKEHLDHQKMFCRMSYWLVWWCSYFIEHF